MYTGIGTSGGIGIGNALVLEHKQPEVVLKKIADAGSEIERYYGAREHFISDTNSMIDELSDKLGQKSAAILKNQIFLINDAEMNESIIGLIKEKMLCAEAAVDEVYNSYRDLFLNMENESMRHRAADIEDMRSRLTGILMGIDKESLSDIPERTVIVVHELVPSMTAELDTRHIAGIVAECGGETSHAAILARTLGIPAVLAVNDAKKIINNGDVVIVDGNYGEVFVNPISKTIQIYERKQQESIEKMNSLLEFSDRETITSDGKKLHLYGNIGGPEDIAKVLGSGGEGIGLFRTEFLFMNGYVIPTEEEQFIAYKKAAVMARGRDVIIRTLDIGGDKNVPYMGLPRESNPFLGYRAIRYCLDRTDIFRAQLRAILRASAFGKIKIMLPLITSVSEVIAVKRHLHNISLELEKSGVEFDREIKVGVMIETPAASLIADLLAEEVDFFSIGTNDLIQYTMAVDRCNENVSYLYSPYNPAVLRSIRHIIQCAKTSGIPVGMCGEAAADPKMIPLLIAFGLDEFSVSAANILETRKNIASWNMEEVTKIAETVMKFHTEKEVSQYLSEVDSQKRQEVI